jgi:hypothetical protein
MDGEKSQLEDGMSVKLEELCFHVWTDLCLKLVELVMSVGAAISIWNVCSKARKLRDLNSYSTK